MSTVRAGEQGAVIVVDVLGGLGCQARQDAHIPGNEAPEATRPWARSVPEILAPTSKDHPPYARPERLWVAERVPARSRPLIRQNFNALLDQTRPEPGYCAPGGVRARTPRGSCPTAMQVDISPTLAGSMTIRIQRLLALGLLAMLQACVVVPRTTQAFDAECQVVANQMVLEEFQIAAIQQCANQGCIALIVGAGIVTAASLLVSGTIVIAGNIAYWLEKQSLCRKTPQ